MTGTLVLLAALLLSETPPGDRPVTVASHRAMLTLEPLSRVYDCVDTVVVRYGAGESDSAFLRLHPAYSPVSVTIGDRQVPFSFRSGRLWWERGGGDSTAEIVIAFRGRIDFASEYTRVTADRAILKAEEVLPWGEGTLDSGRLGITVPSDWEVIAPGTRIPGPGRDDAPTVITGGPIDGAGTRTHLFEWKIPIASLGWICAGKYILSAGPPASGHTSLFRIPKEGAGDTARDAGIVALCDSLLRFYGGAFVPYRFDRFDVVEVDDWVAGWSVLAIAAPSFIMVKRMAFDTDDPYNRVETILPHEVAHQWWMGAVFPVPRAIALLSEGLCEYSSILYAGASGSGRSRDTLARSPLLRPLISKVKRGTAIPLDTALDIRSVLSQYLKAAYVHHMLRAQIGDGPFRETLSRFARRFEGRSAGIPDFRDVAEEVSGRDLGWFFDQWVTGKGLPALRAYNVRAGKSGAGWLATGRLRVVGYDRYTVEATLEARSPAGISRTKVSVGFDTAGGYRNDVPFAIPCSAEPSSVAVDPDGALLLLRRLPPKLSDLRDPGDALMVVGGGSRGGLYRTLAAEDSARLARQGWDVRIIADSTVTLGDLQRDRLILYGGTSDNTVAADLRGALPMAVSGDSAVISGETVRDSTLGLIQAGANPWLDDGVLIWVQPFGGTARPEIRPFDDSWVLLRGAEKIDSGTWESVDDGMVAPVRREP
jgi:hypothetical protein